MTEPPAKEAVEPQLRGELEQQAASAVYDDLRKDARIDILFGKPKDGEAPAAPDAPDDGSGAPATEAPANETPATEPPATQIGRASCRKRARQYAQIAVAAD